MTTTTVNGNTLYQIEVYIPIPTDKSSDLAVYEEFLYGETKRISAVEKKSAIVLTEEELEHAMTWIYKNFELLLNGQWKRSRSGTHTWNQVLCAYRNEHKEELKQK